MRCEKIVEIKESDLMEVCKKVHKLRSKHEIPLSNVIVDEDGVGGGVKDSLNCKGFIANSTPIKVEWEKENYNNLKSQCAFTLAKYVNESNIYVNCDPDQRDILSQELEVIKKKNIDKEQKNQVISKEEMKKLLGRSPDYADMLIMRMYFELEKSVSWVDHL